MSPRATTSLWTVIFILLTTAAWHIPRGVVSFSPCPYRTRRQQTLRFTSSDGSSSSVHDVSRETKRPLSPTVLLIVDVENVRGKSHFQWTHEGLLASATAYRNQYQPEAVVALVVDHGAVPSILTSGPLEPLVGVLFSGPTLKADDVIVSLVRELQHSTVSRAIHTTILVTADRELMDRCQKASSHRKSSVTIVDPLVFLSEIESFGDDNQSLSTIASMDEQQVTANGDAVRRELGVRQELQRLARLLSPRGKGGKKRNVSRKQRTKLMMRRDRTRNRLYEVMEESLVNGTPTLQSITAGESVDNNDELETDSLDDAIRAMEASRQGQRASRVESTYERQILAERLRRRLLLANADSCHGDVESMLEALFTVNYDTTSSRLANNVPNGMKLNDLDIWKRDGRSLSSSIMTVPRNYEKPSAFEDRDPALLLRLVVLSDTHGLEGQLFQHTARDNDTGDDSGEPYRLPPADVLIHCGDFSGSGARKAKIQARDRLDAFLAAQTHIPTKVVLRGNHDPHSSAKSLFPRSKALYATKPMTLTLPNDMILGLRSFSRSIRGDTMMTALPACDILASHEPPFGILDLTYQKQRAGSLALRRAVEATTMTKKPFLWLCGHIHEGRGSVLHSFDAKEESSTKSESSSTLVINAANANAGQANRIVAGPVIVHVVDALASTTVSAGNTLSREAMPSSNAATTPTTLLRPDSLQALVASSSSAPRMGTFSNNPRRLLAVDLGLRTATVMLDGSGRILKVDHWQFEDVSSLENAIDDMLVNVTHVVVEGTDGVLWEVWKKAVERQRYAASGSGCGCLMARVLAEDWRDSLLLARERKNKQSAKDAAVLIAKQVLELNGIQGSGLTGNSKLTKDAAEAILVGHYAVRMLGWVETKTPPVKRYSNGDVMRPKVKAVN